MTLAPTPPTESLSEDPLIPISSVALAPNIPLGVDVYLKPTSSSSSAVLFCSSRDAPTPESLRQLKAGSSGKLFVRRSNAALFQQYLREKWRAIVSDPERHVSERCGVLSQIVREVLRNTIESDDTGAMVSGALRLGDVIVDCLAEQRHLATDIYSVLHHDYSTFTHSTNVSFYAVLLARELGISRQDYRRIAIGGLLHDIGKRHLQSNLINKPGGLTRQEYVEVQLHPRLGFEELATRSELNYGQLMMVYQHHERIDGSGYPTRVSGSEIHLWARLCSVVDAFEALTSDRPYRRSTSPQAAIEIMRRGAGTALDAELLTCWEGLVAGKLEQRR